MSVTVASNSAVNLCRVVWCGVVWCGAGWCGVVWCGVHGTCAEMAAESGGTSHATNKQRCTYTTSVDIQNAT